MPKSTNNSMEYHHLRPEEQHQIWLQHVIQAESDHFSHTLNAAQAKAAGDPAQAQQQSELATAAKARRDALEELKPAPMEASEDG